MSIKENFVMKLWDIANYITGFAIAQSLAFAFIFLKADKLGSKLNPDNTSFKIIIFISIGCLFYMIGVWWALSRAKTILKSLTIENGNLIKRSFNQSIIGRWVAIIFFTILDICVISIVSNYTSPVTI
jgi:hypothetical protein